MKTITLFAFLLIAAIPLSACNTVEGFGQDVEKAGEKIQSL